jgi:hypothetical protein
VPPAEHVQRQVAVAVIIAVKEAALLMAVQRGIGGVEIEGDRLGGVLWASRKRSTNRPSIAAGSCPILW